MTRLGRRSCWLLSTLVLMVTILLLASAVPAGAQVTSAGQVNGVVTDKTGAVVPGAAITLTDTSTQEQRNSTSNAAGQYVFVNVPPGKYNITVVKTGFSKFVISAQTVTVGSPVTANVILEVGAATQTVEVAATGVELQTTNATIGNTVTGVTLESLPTLGRDVSSFVTLQPGISPDGSVAGTVVDQSSFQLDGGNNTNDMDGSMSVYTPSFAGDPTGGISNQSNGVAAGPTGVMPTPGDSVEEFKVSSALQGADFNSSSGAQVQVVTKRGTGTWHGTVYEYYLDNNFNANTWVNNHNGLPNADYHYNRFGAAAGGPILPRMLGGKTYFFANYQGFRWPNATTIERAVPSAAMRAGFLTFPDAAGNPVTYNVATFDPLGIGINPLVRQFWNKYMPQSNEATCSLSRCDGANIQGFIGNVGTPQNDNFGVARLDHDFGDKWHFMSSYRYYHLVRATTNQVDIGGFFPGDTLGTPAAVSNRPQTPWYLVAGLTTNISSNTTNDFHYSFLRNFWQYGTLGAPPQISGLAGALEPGGESATQVLGPFNVDTQNTRTRFWDGHDHTFKDDVTTLHGKHMFQFGGQYQHNFDYHQRSDNGGGIDYFPTYQLGTNSGAGSGIDLTGYTPPGISPTDPNWGRDYAAMLGMVSIAQVAYTRSGTSLNLNPPLTPAFDKSTIPYYNMYFSDTWRMKPRFTLTYGLGWTLEMPPTEAAGKQVELVDSSNHPIALQTYMHDREAAALAGQVYNPEVGFSLIGNVAGHPKYPYNPYYKEFSPRVAAAFDILGNGNDVVRAGYSRIYGRLNGVDLVLVPLLGDGLIQAVQCVGALAPAYQTAQNFGCGGTGGATPVTAFRVGVNGLVAPLGQAPSQTLPQPIFPGINGPEAGAAESLDPNFRPNVVDSVDLTYQHQISRKMSMEMGYIGRWIKNEYMPVNINAVPYMMTLGGQRFDKAYANMVLQYCGGINGLRGGGCAGNVAAVTPQPFFEAALAGTGYCDHFANCTQAVASNEGGNISVQNVWNLWSDLDNGGGVNSMGFNFPHSMLNTAGQLSSGVAVNASIGYGNYNAGFLSLKMSDWKGLTMQSNLTWSRALGTGAEVQATSESTPPDPFNLRTGYGLQAFDRPLVFNTFFVYQPSWYKGQHGLAGHLLGGWTFAPVFTAGSGLPITLGTINGGGQAFGEGDSANFFGYGVSENAIPIGQLPSVGVHYTNGSNGIGNSGFGVNLFANPAAAYNDIRQPILGLDTRDGGFGVLRGLPYWNMDFSLKKKFMITERVNFEAQLVVTNLFNHVQFQDPGPGDYIDTSNAASFGTLPGQYTGGGYNPARQMEFGFRVSF